jgi:hypothetical protein
MVQGSKITVHVSSLGHTEIIEYLWFTVNGS